MPSPVPFGNHVLSDHEEMEIQCRVSDPSANVTLVNVDTQQPVPCVYDSKRGALGVFTAGTYICKALINGEEHYSSEYIVHGWTGVCSHNSKWAILPFKCDLSTLSCVWWICTLTQSYHISGGAALHVELTAKRTALLVGDTITVTCVAQGSEILEDHWKYPGKLVRTQVILCRTKDNSIW